MLSQRVIRLNACIIGDQKRLDGAIALESTGKEEQARMVLAGKLTA
jgi:hypothetical protein